MWQCGHEKLKIYLWTLSFTSINIIKYGNFKTLDDQLLTIVPFNSNITAVKKKKTTQFQSQKIDTQLLFIATYADKEMKIIL